MRLDSLMEYEKILGWIRIPLPTFEPNDGYNPYYHKHKANFDFMDIDVAMIDCAKNVQIHGYMATKGSALLVQDYGSINYHRYPTDLGFINTSNDRQVITNVIKYITDNHFIQKYQRYMRNGA